MTDKAHIFYDREDGLQHCKVCNGGEGSLPTECLGRRMSESEEEQVYEGVLDFKGGIWYRPVGGSTGEPT